MNTKGIDEHSKNLQEHLRRIKDLIKRNETNPNASSAVLEKLDKLYRCTEEKSLSYNTIMKVEKAIEEIKWRTERIVDEQSRRPRNRRDTDRYEYRETYNNYEERYSRKYERTERTYDYETPIEIVSSNDSSTENDQASKCMPGSTFLENSYPTSRFECKPSFEVSIHPENKATRENIEGNSRHCRKSSKKRSRSRFDRRHESDKHRYSSTDRNRYVYKKRNSYTYRSSTEKLKSYEGRKSDRNDHTSDDETSIEFPSSDSSSKLSDKADKSTSFTTSRFETQSLTKKSDFNEYRAKRGRCEESAPLGRSRSRTRSPFRLYQEHRPDGHRYSKVYRNLCENKQDYSHNEITEKLNFSGHRDKLSRSEEKQNSRDSLATNPENDSDDSLYNNLQSGLPVSTNDTFIEKEPFKSLEKPQEQPNEAPHASTTEPVQSYECDSDNEVNSENMTKMKSKLSTLIKSVLRMRNEDIEPSSVITSSELPTSQHVPVKKIDPKIEFNNFPNVVDTKLEHSTKDNSTKFNTENKRTATSTESIGSFYIDDEIIKQIVAQSASHIKSSSQEQLSPLTFDMNIIKQAVATAQMNASSYKAEVDLRVDANDSEIVRYSSLNTVNPPRQFSQLNCFNQQQELNWRVKAQGDSLRRQEFCPQPQCISYNPSIQSVPDNFYPKLCLLPPQPFGYVPTIQGPMPTPDKSPPEHNPYQAQTVPNHTTDQHNNKFEHQNVRRFSVCHDTSEAYPVSRPFLLATPSINRHLQKYQQSCNTRQFNICFNKNVPPPTSKPNLFQTASARNQNDKNVDHQTYGQYRANRRSTVCYDKKEAPCTSKLGILPTPAYVYPHPTTAFPDHIRSQHEKIESQNNGQPRNARRSTVWYGRNGQPAFPDNIANQGSTNLKQPTYEQSGNNSRSEICSDKNEKIESQNNGQPRNTRRSTVWYGHNRQPAFPNNIANQDNTSVNQQTYEQSGNISRSEICSDKNKALCTSKPIVEHQKYVQPLKVRRSTVSYHNNESSPASTNGSPLEQSYSVHTKSPYNVNVEHQKYGQHRNIRRFSVCDNKNDTPMINGGFRRPHAAASSTMKNIKNETVTRTSRIDTDKSYSCTSRNGNNSTSIPNVPTKSLLPIFKIPKKLNQCKVPLSEIHTTNDWNSNLTTSQSVGSQSIVKSGSEPEDMVVNTKKIKMDPKMENRTKQSPVSENNVVVAGSSSNDDKSMKENAIANLRELLNPNNIIALFDLMENYTDNNTFAALAKVKEALTDRETKPNPSILNGGDTVILSSSTHFEKVDVSKGTKEKRKNEVERLNEGICNMFSGLNATGKRVSTHHANMESRKFVANKKRDTATKATVRSLSTVSDIINDTRNELRPEPVERPKSALSQASPKKRPKIEKKGSEVLRAAIKNNNPECHSLNKAIGCQICDEPRGLSLVSHYVNNHSSNEVLISRISPEAAELLRKSGQNQTFKINIKAKRYLYEFQQYCFFCNIYKCLSKSNWIRHTTTHTGYYQFECTQCLRKFAQKGAHSCEKKNNKNILIKIPQPMFQKENVTAYLCDLCNFVRFHKHEMEKHLSREHDGNVTKMFKEVIFLTFSQSQSNKVEEYDSETEDEDEIGNGEKIKDKEEIEDDDYDSEYDEYEKKMEDMYERELEEQVEREMRAYEEQL